MIKQTIISAPFGNYVSLPNATRVRGTFTWWSRPGAWKQAFKTIRPIREGWVNRIGLRNPGIMKCLETGDFEKDIYSIAAIKLQDWEDLLHILPENYNLELNLGCPNADEVAIERRHLRAFGRYNQVIVKVPPLWREAQRIIDEAYQEGLNTFHIANTLPVERGGESGRRLQAYTLPMIERVKARYDDTIIVGGGGIYAPADVRRYRDAGADIFSLATIFFTPWRIPFVLREINREV